MFMNTIQERSNKPPFPFSPSALLSHFLLSDTCNGPRGLVAHRVHNSCQGSNLIPFSLISVPVKDKQCTKRKHRLGEKVQIPYRQHPWPIDCRKCSSYNLWFIHQKNTSIPSSKIGSNPQYSLPNSINTILNTRT